MKKRVEVAKSDSDFAFFFDLLNYGEMVTKVITLYLVSTINDDKNRTRYREEHGLARANAIGNFSEAIDRILTGPQAEYLNTLIETRIKRINAKVRCEHGNMNQIRTKELP